MLAFWRKLWGKRKASPNRRTARGNGLTTTWRFWLIVETLENRIVPAANYSANAIPFTATPLSTTDPGVFSIISSGEDVANPVPLGTNHINVYGLDYTDTPDRNWLWASSNGILTIYKGDTGFGNSDLTTAPDVPTIAALWSSWTKFPGGTPMVVGKVDTADNLLIVQWNDLLHTGGNSNTVTFQVVVQLNTGNNPGTITVNYFNISTGDQNGDGATSAVGLKNWGPQGPGRLLVSQNALNPLIGSNQSIQFTWGDPAPQPTITSLSQESAPETNPGLPVTVNGSNFESNAVVQLNGTALPTTFVSSSQLQTTIPASALAEEGTLGLTVFNPGSPSKTSSPHSFTVFDALLTAQGQTLSAAEGQTLNNGVVASFTDPGSDGTIADYTATITWTDNSGQTHDVPGTVQATGPQTFNVVAGNLGPFAEEGTYPLVVALADKGGSNASAQSTLTVADALLNSTGQHVNATTGLAFTSPVATFTDANPYAQASDFTATIKWGDGQTSQGTITSAGNGGFGVTGTHTFASAGSSAVSVQITDKDGAATTAQGTATVTDSIPTVTLTQFRRSHYVVQIFGTYSDLVARHHTAVINWGDGTIKKLDLGVSASGLVPLTHTYTKSFADKHQSTDITVTIVDDDGTSSPVEVSHVDFQQGWPSSVNTRVRIVSPTFGSQAQRFASVQGQLHLPPQDQEWPVVLIRPLLQGEPWYVQPEVLKVQSNGTFTTPVYVGNASTPPGTYFLVEVVLAKSPGDAHKLFPEGAMMNSLPAGLAVSNPVVVYR